MTPDRVQQYEHHVTQPHHAFGDEGWGANVQKQHADRHDGVADDHKRRNLPNLPLVRSIKAPMMGSVMASNTRIAVTMTDANTVPQQQDRAAEGGHIGQDQDVVDVGRTVVHGNRTS